MRPQLFCVLLGLVFRQAQRVPTRGCVNLIRALCPLSSYRKNISLFLQIKRSPHAPCWIGTYGDIPHISMWSSDDPGEKKTNQSQLKSSRCNLGGTRHPRGARLLELLLPPVVGAAAELVNQPLVWNNLKNFVLVVIPERMEIIIVSLIKQFYYQCTCVLQSRREFTSMNLK